MIETILATDISSHTKNLNTLKTKLDTFGVKKGKNVNNLIYDDNVIKTYENQQAVLSMCIHSADISNSAKVENIQKTWIDLEFEELFEQGDIELKQGLPVSLLCDRKTICIYKYKIGFIKFAVLPTFECLVDIMPEIGMYVDVINDNIVKYEILANKEIEHEVKHK